MPKEDIGYFPYTLFYGKDAMLHMHLELNTIYLATTLEDEERVGRT
jgi:hypothetical protein